MDDKNKDKILKQYRKKAENLQLSEEMKLLFSDFPAAKDELVLSAQEAIPAQCFLLFCELSQEIAHANRMDRVCRNIVRIFHSQRN